MSVQTGQWVAKTSYSYDTTAIDAQTTNAPGHDSSYGSTFTARGNVTAVSRWDVNDINNSNLAVTNSSTYDAAGNVLSTADALGHTTTVGYSDWFSDGNNSRGTFAYATGVTDADGYSSSAQYMYEYGALTRTYVPTSGTTQAGNVTHMDVERQAHRTFDYDGHGRLSRRVTPEQGETIYSYYADDTTNVVRDARMVTTTYHYNNRHQITWLQYDVSNDPTHQAQATADAHFDYDSAGNRTSMSDGLGSASYNFNNLGQMYSETRSFTNVGNYTLNYQYNLAGELKKITNSWSGAEVNYGYDKAGRLTNVGGAGYANVTSYASGLAYRAFGAIKGMNYGDGHSLSTAYDNRLRPTTWNVANVLGYNYQYGGWFQENTGRVVYAQNIASAGTQPNGAADSRLDRSYQYDDQGRLVVSHSGAEARAHVLQQPWGTMDGPYSLGFDYDAWGNMTRRYGWGGEVQQGNAGQSSEIPYYYANGKNQRDSFGYDAAGNLTNDSQSYLYDATGQQVYASGFAGASWGPAPTYHDEPIQVNVTTVQALHISELRTAINRLRNHFGWGDYLWQSSATTSDYITANPIIEMRTALDQALGAGSYAVGLAQGQPVKAIHIQELRDRVTTVWNAYSSGISQAYDGDGLRVKKTEYGATIYYLRSTVLGGQPIAELNYNQQSGWFWSRGYVYSGSNLLAVQQGGVFWVYEDPITKSKRVCDANGTVVSRIELDPFGADTDRSWGQAFQPKRFTSYDRDANGSDEAMFRRYNRWHSRFDQPDPYGGSYNLSNPQSLNRYAYTKNDPVNFVDPTGLDHDADRHGPDPGHDIPSGPNTPVYVYAGGFGGFGDNNLMIEEGPVDLWPSGFGGGPGGGGGGVVVSGGGHVAPQNTGQTPKPPPCPPVPAHPPTADIRANIAEAGQHGPASAFNPAKPVVDLNNMVWFRNQVKNKGPWDYKQQGRQYQDFGNFNYGATGLATGLFNETVLLVEAGKGQIAAGTSKPGWGYPPSLRHPRGQPPYGDDPADQAQIQAGFAYYNAVRGGCQ